MFRFLASIIDFIYPPECHLCGGTLPRGVKYICPGCRELLPRTNYHTIPGNPMEQRFAGLFPFQKATSLLFYSSEAQLAQLVQDFKYRKFPGLAKELGKMLGEELATSDFFADIDIIIPVPMHWIKIKKRGYNQAEELAKGVSIATGIPIKRHLIAKRHKTQTAKNAYERHKNVRNVFRLKNACQVNGKHILIIDDICTTGATLESVSQIIHSQTTGCRITLLTLGTTF